MSETLSNRAIEAVQAGVASVFASYLERDAILRRAKPEMPGAARLLALSVIDHIRKHLARHGVTVVVPLHGEILADGVDPESNLSGGFFPFHAMQLMERWEGPEDESELRKADAFRAFLKQTEDSTPVRSGTVTVKGRYDLSNVPEMEDDDGHDMRKAIQNMIGGIAASSTPGPNAVTLEARSLKTNFDHLVGLAVRDANGKEVGTITSCRSEDGKFVTQVQLNDDGVSLLDDVQRSGPFFNLSRGGRKDGRPIDEAKTFRPKMSSTFRADYLNRSPDELKDLIGWTVRTYDGKMIGRITGYRRRLDEDVLDIEFNRNGDQMAWLCNERGLFEAHDDGLRITKEFDPHHEAVQRLLNPAVPTLSQKHDQRSGLAELQKAMENLTLGDIHEVMIGMEIVPAPMEPASAPPTAWMHGERCSTCNSPSPELHPAMQYEGEVQPCTDAFHKRIVNGDELCQCHTPPWPMREHVSEAYRTVEAAERTYQNLTLPAGGKADPNEEPPNPKTVWEEGKRSLDGSRGG